MHICEINQNYQYPQDRVYMYKLAVYQFPEFLLTSYFIYITFPFIIDPYKYLFHSFKLIIRVTKCIFVKLIENVNIN